MTVTLDALESLAAAWQLPLSLARVLQNRGFADAESGRRFLNPSLDHLSDPRADEEIQRACARLRSAIEREERIGLYGDRDVDGISGVAILARSLRTLGAQVVWTVNGASRGVDAVRLQTLLSQQPAVVVFIDCGSNEPEAIQAVHSTGADVIVADHHRVSARPPVLGWIHPDTLSGGPEGGAPGSVMAFKIAQALWLDFLGNDAERLDYFLWDHVDLAALGILADRASLIGENRVLVWHGLRRIPTTRKTGLQLALRFFKLSPRTEPLDAHEASWYLIPFLNAAGRMGRADLAAEFLISDDWERVQDAFETMMALNRQRQKAQDESAMYFEKAVHEQCNLSRDSVLVAVGENLEPTVTGLAAQRLVEKYKRPAFLFVKDGDAWIGSGRAHGGVDLYGWVEKHESFFIRFGGHAGAVGMTVNPDRFDDFRQAIQTGLETTKPEALSADTELLLNELDETWWTALEKMSPFGDGHAWPTFRVSGIDKCEKLENPLKPSKSFPFSRCFRLSTGSQNVVAFSKSDVERVGEEPVSWMLSPWFTVGKKKDRRWILNR